MEPAMYNALHSNRDTEKAPQKLLLSLCTWPPMLALILFGKKGGRKTNNNLRTPFQDSKRDMVWPENGNDGL